MERKIVTLAIHTKPKALIIRRLLEENNINVDLEPISQDETNEDASEGFAVKIDGSQVSKALTLIEAHDLFNYNDQETYKVDDGRKRILVAVDFSLYSLKACQMAFSIAKEINAKVKILHVYHNIYFPSTIPFANLLKEDEGNDILDKSRKQMLNLCLEIDKRIAEGEYPSVNYSYSLREGLVNEEIESFIKEYKPNLVVLGTKGQGNSQDYMLGSVTADIIEMTDVPIMAVPKNATITDVKEFKHIAFFTNFSERDHFSFDFLVNILLLHPTLKVTLVHVNRLNEKGKQRSATELAELRDTFLSKHPNVNINYKLIEGTDIIPLIKQFIDDEKVNLITVNTRRRNLIGRLFVPSTSRKILATIDTPLLTLRGHILSKQ